jgi:hypothetical protein
MANYESVLLLLSLTAEKSPALSAATLEKHFPLLTWIIQQARYQRQSPLFS